MPVDIFRNESLIELGTYLVARDDSDAAVAALREKWALLRERNLAGDYPVDILVSSDGKEPFAVLSIGGFLGMGSHLVAVPYDSLKFVDKKFELPGGTKESLKMLPEFKYASE